VAINKPHGLLVHQSKIARDATEFALQSLRDQLNQTVYPVHRLDRKTSGVLLFALNKEALVYASDLFREKQVYKEYHAVVRGFITNNGIIDYPLKSEKGVLQEARTVYKLLQRYELPIAHGAHATSRYTLVKLMPETGRMHQLRRHMAHNFHPIIGDRPHGCNKQNKFWKEQFNMTQMMLHATELSFNKSNSEVVRISADYSAQFKGVLEILDEHKV